MADPTPNAVVTARIQTGTHNLILRARSDAGPLQFVPGQFVNLGLPGDDGKMKMRPYSVASAPGAAETEFALTLVENGLVTPSLWRLQPGDRVYMETVAAGSFTLRDVPEGAALLIVATGTGTAPFMSMLRAGLWKNRDVTVVHGARTAHGLAYADELKSTPRVSYLPVVSRDPQWTGKTGRVELILGEVKPMPDGVHALLCGNPEMIKDVRALLEGRGFKKHRKRDPGNLHFEAYW